MATKDIGLYRRQLDILRSPGREILAAGSGGGKSHALRSGLVLFASTRPGSSCVLLHPNEEELRREHVEGATGFKALLSEASQEGVVDIRPGDNEARFANGSILTWLALDRPADLRRLGMLDKVDLGCVDEAHRVAQDQIETLAMKTGHAVPRGRLIAAAPEVTGWIRDRWASFTDGVERAIIETSGEDLPEALRVVAQLPTLPEFIDSLGVPFLAPNGKFRQTRHVQKILSVLQRWFYGEFKRVLFLVPTQHGKTTLAVRIMVAYIQHCRPYETCGVSSYTDRKAIERNQDARDYYLKAGGHLRDGASSKDYWKTQYGGGSWAAGVVGASAGNPMTWGFFDDPDKDTKDSRSAVRMKDKDNWILETWLGREDKFADRMLSQCWAATRFWRHDTVGRTLDMYVKKGEGWHICALPALYDPAVGQYYERLAPGLFTVEPDFREEPGEPLWDKFDREYWAKEKKASLRVFMGRGQQKPEESDGATVFDESWPIDLSADPAHAGGVLSPREVYYRPIRGWDLATTAGGGDWTACLSMGELKGSERVVLRHAARARLGPQGVKRFIAGTMLLDGPDTDIALPLDPAAGAQALVSITEYLRRVARSVSIDCLDCEGRSCTECGGSGRIRFGNPTIIPVPTREGITLRFEDFADRARPIGDFVEGRVDFVATNWAPKLEDAVPWFQRAVEAETDRDHKEELRQIRLLMRRFLANDDDDLVWLDWQDPYLRELHLFPDDDHDDWAAATAHCWGALKAPRSVYPKG